MATLSLKISPEDMLQVVQEMPLDELTRFTDKVLQVKAQHMAASLTVDEERLIQEIDKLKLSPKTHQRLLVLGAKLEDEELSAAEQEELQHLSEKSEKINAQRLAKVAELATLWQKPLPEVMKQLGLWRSYAQ